jgi:hypothetical protein
MNAGPKPSPQTSAKKFQTNEKKFLRLNRPPPQILSLQDQIYEK